MAQLQLSDQIDGSYETLSPINLQTIRKVLKEYRQVRKCGLWQSLSDEEIQYLYTAFRVLSYVRNNWRRKLSNLQKLQKRHPEAPYLYPQYASVDIHNAYNVLVYCMRKVMVCGLQSMSLKQPVQSNEERRKQYETFAQSLPMAHSAP